MIYVLTTSTANKKRYYFYNNIDKNYYYLIKTDGFVDSYYKIIDSFALYNESFDYFIPDDELHLKYADIPDTWNEMIEIFDDIIIRKTIEQLK
jgi:hypothetical protein